MALDTNFNFDEFDKLELNKQPKNPSPISKKIKPKTITEEESNEILKKNFEYIKKIVEDNNFGDDDE